MFTLKILTHLCFTKQKIKIKNVFVKVVQCFSDEKVLIKHKEDCLSIDGVQSVHVEKGTIEFEDYFKQLPVPFKIHADFECNLKDVEIYEDSYTKKYHEHVPCSYAFKVVCIDDRFSKSIVVYRAKNVAYEFIKEILEEYKYCKKVMKEHFNKNLVMAEEEEHLFRESNNCWICKKLIDNDDEKVRDHCHVTDRSIY